VEIGRGSVLIGATVRHASVEDAESAAAKVNLDAKNFLKTVEKYALRAPKIMEMTKDDGGFGLDLCNLKTAVRQKLFAPVRRSRETGAMEVPSMYATTSTVAPATQDLPLAGVTGFSFVSTAIQSSQTAQSSDTFDAWSAVPSRLDQVPVIQEQEEVPSPANAAPHEDLEDLAEQVAHTQSEPFNLEKELVQTDDFVVDSTTFMDPLSAENLDPVSAENLEVSASSEEPSKIERVESGEKVAHTDEPEVCNAPPAEEPIEATLPNKGEVSLETPAAEKPTQTSMQPTWEVADRKGCQSEEMPAAQEPIEKALPSKGEEPLETAKEESIPKSVQPAEEVADQKEPVEPALPRKGDDSLETPKEEPVQKSVQPTEEVADQKDCKSEEMPATQEPIEVALPSKGADSLETPAEESTQKSVRSTEEAVDQTDSQPEEIPATQESLVQTPQGKDTAMLPRVPLQPMDDAESCRVSVSAAGAMTNETFDNDDACQRVGEYVVKALLPSELDGDEFSEAAPYPVPAASEHTISLDQESSVAPSQGSQKTVPSSTRSAPKESLTVEDKHAVATRLMRSCISRVELGRPSSSSTSPMQSGAGTLLTDTLTASEEELGQKGASADKVPAISDLKAVELNLAKQEIEVPVVSVEFRFDGLSYDALLATAGMVEAFAFHMQRVLSMKANVHQDCVEVQLLRGSIAVHATIDCYDEFNGDLNKVGPRVQTIRESMDNNAEDLVCTIEKCAWDIPGIHDLVISGPSRKLGLIDLKTSIRQLLLSARKSKASSRPESAGPEVLSKVGLAFQHVGSEVATEAESVMNPADNPPGLLSAAMKPPAGETATAAENEAKSFPSLAPQSEAQRSQQSMALVNPTGDEASAVALSEAAVNPTADQASATALSEAKAGFTPKNAALRPSQSMAFVNPTGDEASAVALSEAAVNPAADQASAIALSEAKAGLTPKNADLGSAQRMAFVNPTGDEASAVALS